jgi:membrane associated rhomboid family serine protease
MRARCSGSQRASIVPDETAKKAVDSAMFPYRDENPTEKPAIITVAIIAINALVFILDQGAGAQGPLAHSVCRLGLMPGELLHTARPGSGVELAPGVYCLVASSPRYWTVLTSMFAHGGWLHLLGNMLFLWVFGNNIEDAMGHAKFVVFYLLCGVAAAATQTLLSPHSVVPMIGASGAISGVLGAYLLLYPKVRVHTLIILPIYITSVALPAWVMLGYWALLQLVSGLAGLSQIEKGGVAFFAHVGGFVAGLVLIRLFASDEVLRRRPTPPAGYFRYRAY